MLDLILENGLVIDGTKQPARRADIGILDDRIAEIGDLSAAQARCQVDISGQIAAPGFIEVHGHSDGWLLHEANRRLVNRLGLHRAMLRHHR